ncbi:14331_t:CDS:1, partial [Racocetra fulgida]
METEKISLMESYLALHCKGGVPDEIRRHWLVEVAKRNDKNTDYSNNESALSASSIKPLHSYSKPVEP